jgi:hypothetical protein
MLIVAIFFFLRFLKDHVYDMCQFLDEQDMWNLVEKNPKETGLLQKHNTKVSL